MLVLILVLMNANGDDSFVWFLRLSVCFGCFSCLGWRRGAALLGWALNPLGPEGPWNTLFAVLPAERWTRELLQSRQGQLAQLWTWQQYATLWNSLLPARWLFFSSVLSLSKGLHHLPVFHSLCSRGKEWKKSTCCFYHINLCDVAWSEDMYILSI